MWVSRNDRNSSKLPSPSNWGFSANSPCINACQRPRSFEMEAPSLAGNESIVRPACRNFENIRCQNTGYKPSSSHKYKCSTKCGICSARCHTACSRSAIPGNSRSDVSSSAKTRKRSSWIELVSKSQPANSSSSRRWSSVLAVPKSSAVKEAAKNTSG